jgi:protocatechuate 3,4-dioxygenase beta subunit
MSQRVGLLITALWLSIAASSVCAVRMDAQDEKSTKDVKAKRDATQVRGQVVMESDGKLVGDADVRLVTWSNNNTRYNVKKARSGKDGEFVFDGVEKGRHRLTAFFEDFASRQARYKGLEVDSSSSELVTLKLSKMPQIAVRVVAKADGKPIENAHVRLVWTDTAPNYRTDSKGSVLLRALTPEVWNVNVEAKGFAAKEEAVNLVGSQSANTTFELEPGGVLFGTVKDEAGMAIAAAGVSIFPANFSGPQTTYKKTDANGGFRFEALPLDKGLMAIVSKKGFLEVRPDFVLGGAAGNTHELNMVLKRRPNGGTVRGTVTDKDSKPIAGAIVTSQGRNSDDVRKATSDADGKFSLDDVFEGSIGHEMIVKAQGFAPQRLAFTPGTKEKPGEVVIKMDAGHRIRGRVVDDNGKPIASARIYYADGNHGMASIGGGTVADTNGKFEIDSLPSDAPFSISANGYSEVEAIKLLLDGDDEVVVKLPQEGMIRGKVIDAVTRKPISPFNVRITFSPDRRNDEPGHHLSGARSTTPEGERFANAEGIFVLKELIAKMPLQLTVAATGYEQQVYRRIVAEAKSEAAEIVVPLLPVDASKLFALHGRIVDSEGKPIARAELRLITADKIEGRRGQPGGFLASNEYPFNWQMIQSGQVESVEGVSQFMSTVSNKDGTFAFEKIRPAAVMEIAYWGEGVSQNRQAQLERLTPEERGELIIKSVSPGIVGGTIDRKALPDVTGLQLLASKSTSFDYHRTSVTADQTKYEIRNVPPGQYELQVEGKPIRTVGDSFTSNVLQRHAIEVHDGETITLDLGRKGVK